MPNTKTAEPNRVATTTNLVGKAKPVQATKPAGRAAGRAKAPAARRARAASCQGCPRSSAGTAGGSASRTPRTVSTTRCERRFGSRSTSRTHPPAEGIRRRASPPARRVAPSAQPPANPQLCEAPREQRTTQRHATETHKAFTVIPPNPKKRKEIQKKAEAELAALEELRLSRAMAYVSINPSSVGGCMSLEEVRLKQQEEMMQARGRQKKMKVHVMEPTHVLY